MSEMSYKQLDEFFQIVEYTITRKIVCPTIGILEQTVYYNDQTFVKHHYLLPLIY